MRFSHVTLVSTLIFFLLFSFSYIPISCSPFTTSTTPVDIRIGEEQGLTAQSSISADTLQKILAGVQNGNRENIYFYGLLKLYGISVVKDTAGAAEQFLRASQLGHKEATTAYGVIRFLGGDGKKEDYTTAIRFFREGVSLGDMNAHWLLGKMLLEGKGVSSPAHTEAALLLRKASEEGNVPQAHHLLGVMYEYGLGVMQNFQTAGKYYHRGAEQHYVESMYHLALMYAYGRGYQQDLVKARSLLDAAARSNHAPSMYYIGIFKTYGYGGLMVNYEQAINWFERAASMGDPRISDKAARNAQELKESLTNALERNEDMLNAFQARGGQSD